MRKMAQTAFQTAKYKDFASLQPFLNNQKFYEDNFQADLMFMVNNWSVYRPKYQKWLQKFQDLLAYRVNMVDNNSLFYPEAGSLQTELQKRNQYKGDHNEADGAQDSFTDTLYGHLVKQLQTKYVSHAPYYILEQDKKTRKMVSDVIAAQKDYNQNDLVSARWHDMFTRLTLNFRNLYSKGAAREKELLSELQTRQQFSNSLQKQRLISYECVTCCPFFYTETNIYDPYVNRYQILTAGAVTGISEQQRNIKDMLCYLLNNGGGAILFDTQRKYREIVPVGEYLDITKQDSVIAKIHKIVQQIKPMPQIGSNIEITFAPLVKNPLHHARPNNDMQIVNNKCYSQSYFKRPFIEGLYVARIKVKPIQGTIAYYWNTEQGPRIPVKTGSNTFEAMEGMKIRKYIKNKFTSHFIPEGVDEEERQLSLFWAPQIHKFHEGSCAAPEHGVPKLSPSEPQGQLSHPQARFAHMSLLIARKVDHQTIKKRLNRKGIECHIRTVYDGHKFKAGTNSAIIHHDIRFDHLLSEMSYNKDYLFNGRYAMVIFISDYVRLPTQTKDDHLVEQDYNVLKQFMDHYHPGQQLKFWSFLNEDKQLEYYLQPSVKEATVLLYYILTQYNIKCLFRNPKNFDKLSQDQKSKRKNVLFPNNQQRSSPDSMTSTSQDSCGRRESGSVCIKRLRYFSEDAQREEASEEELTGIWDTVEQSYGGSKRAIRRQACGKVITQI